MPPFFIVPFVVQVLNIIVIKEVINKVITLPFAEGGIRLWVKEFGISVKVKTGIGMNIQLTIIKGCMKCNVK